MLLRYRCHCSATNFEYQNDLLCSRTPSPHTHSITRAWDGPMRIWLSFFLLLSRMVCGFHTLSSISFPYCDANAYHMRANARVLKIQRPTEKQSVKSEKFLRVRIGCSLEYQCSLFYFCPLFFSISFSLSSSQSFFFPHSDEIENEKPFTMIYYYRIQGELWYAH